MTSELNHKETTIIASSKALQHVAHSLGDHIWSGGEFCHYTDLNGLKGIVENNEVWLSDHRFLNDMTEHSYGKQLAINIINESMHTVEPTNFSTVLEDVLKIIIDCSPVFYVASMSLGRDKLDQWKGYGRNQESICIVFRNDSALGRDGVLTQLPAIEPIQVIYNIEDQEQRIRTIISIFKSEFETNAPCGPSEMFRLWQKNMAFMIAHQLIRFKDPEYSSEEEIRLVLGAGSPILTEKPKHRVSQGRLIPYVTTKNKSLTTEAKLPIKEIIIGPIATQDSVMKSIEVFLSNMGYEDLPVMRSSVPFRG